MVQPTNRDEYDRYKTWFLENYDTSISVQTGGICRFVAISEQYVTDLGTDGVVLPEILKAEKRKFYLALSIILPGGKSLSTYYTTPQTFRDLTGTARVKSKNGLIRRFINLANGLKVN